MESRLFRVINPNGDCAQINVELPKIEEKENGDELGKSRVLNGLKRFFGLIFFWWVYVKKLFGLFIRKEVKCDEQDDKEVLYERYLEYVRIERPVEANCFFVKLLEGEFTDLELWYKRCIQLFTLERSLDGNRMFIKILDQSQENSDVWFERSKQLFNLKRFLEGSLAARKALERKN